MIPQLLMMVLTAIGTLYPVAAGVTNADIEAARPVEPQHEERVMYITAYSSTPEETDDTPFITASGKYVRDGIVATNELPMGTKIRIPAIYGDKVFVVEDRMHKRMKNKVDIWMPTKEQALQFGIKKTMIHVLPDEAEA
jgi:3D (Asp-Asp-Asp) domain-containing protein